MKTAALCALLASTYCVLAEADNPVQGDDASTYIADQVSIGEDDVSLKSYYSGKSYYSSYSYKPSYNSYSYSSYKPSYNSYSYSYYSGGYYNYYYGSYYGGSSAGETLFWLLLLLCCIPVYLVIKCK